MQNQVHTKGLCSPTCQVLILLGCLLLFVAVITARAWLSDDAYITFRVVDNAIDSRGLTWNPDERVQAYTHPLWLFLLIAGRAATGELFYTATLLGIGLSALAVGLLVFRLPLQPTTAALGVLVLTVSRAFADYATSGLENPLTHLLLALFLLVYLIRPASNRRLLTLSFLAALVALNRTDALLLVLPALGLVLWRDFSRRGRSWAAPAAAALGFLPFLLWTAFSLAYYGFPFPNTAYAKLNTGIATADLARQGLVYLGNSLRWDPITLVTIAAAIVLAVAPRRATWAALATGIALYLLYIVRIGGDFMSGRFLTAPLLMAVVVVMMLLDGRLRTRRRQLVAAGVIVALALAGYLPVWLAGNPVGDAARRDGDIADERAYYWPNTGLMNRDRVPHPWATQGLELRAQGPVVIEHGNVGFLGYFAGPDVHIVDRNGLTDPLLARLPVRDPADWRIGHFRRNVPDGYIDTLRGGRNVIADPAIAALYDELAIITRGPLRSAARWRAIWRVNTGDTRPDRWAYQDICWSKDVGAPTCQVWANYGILSPPN